MKSRRAFLLSGAIIPASMILGGCSTWQGLIVGSQSPDEPPTKSAPAVLVGDLAVGFNMYPVVARERGVGDRPEGDGERPATFDATVGAGGRDAQTRGENAQCLAGVEERVAGDGARGVAAGHPERGTLRRRGPHPIAQRDDQSPRRLPAGDRPEANGRHAGQVDPRGPHLRGGGGGRPGRSFGQREERSLVGRAGPYSRGRRGPRNPSPSALPCAKGTSRSAMPHASRPRSTAAFTSTSGGPRSGWPRPRPKSTSS